MSTQQYGREACHNCRRRRLKCDRSLPKCIKCNKKGQECLGYDRLLRWDQGIASRGKLTGVTFEDLSKRSKDNAYAASRALSPVGIPIKQSSPPGSEVSSPRYLTDPLMHDLDYASRKYLYYFASNVCRDLVLYDTPQHNHFRELIPLALYHPILLQVIIANSALHMHNAIQKSAVSSAANSPSSQLTSWSGSPCSDLSAAEQTECYNDALSSKQRALSLLKAALANTTLTNIDVILAVVLLFIEFELIDSGRDTWIHHINGARTIIQSLCQPSLSMQSDLSPLRKFLISNCLIFDIVGTTLASSINPSFNGTLSTDTLSLLQDAEGNHCSSFPVLLLQLMRAGSQSFESDYSETIPTSTRSSNKQQVLLNLLHTAQSFNPSTWASQIQPRSPVADLPHRTHVATAHQAAVCIYLSRILLSFDSRTHLTQNMESLVDRIVTHLSLIKLSDALFTATAWPAFIAGAETNDPKIQAWVATRFRELWEVEPWGLIKGALEVLQRIWNERTIDVTVHDESKDSNEEGKEEGQREDLTDPKFWDGNWIAYLKRSGVDWLIL